MRKKIQRKPRRTQSAEAAVANISDAEVLGEILAAGNGLFWEVENGQVRPYSKPVVEVGLASMWNLWADLESMASAQ
jgi:hypothetical protein